jgi:predicted  nucleic acid-binding Zn-ribbon protein
MKRSIFALGLFLLCALSPAVGQGAPQSDSGPLPDRQVNASADPCVRLRSGAALDRAVLDCLEPGTRLRLLGAISGWSHVRLLDGTEGWVDSGYLEMAPESPAGRTAAEPPTPPPGQPGDDPADGLRGQIAALEGQIAAAAKRHEATEERLRKTVAAAEAAQREASQLRQQVQQLGAAAPQGNRAEQIEEELAAARARVAQREASLAAAEDRVLRAADLNAEQERRIEMLDASLAASKAREADRQQELAAAEDRVRHAEEASTSRANRIQQLEGELPATRDREAELRHNLAEAEDRLRAAELEASEQARRIEELTGELAEADLRVAEAELKARPAGRAEPAPTPPTESLVEVRAPIVSTPEPPKVSVRVPAAAEAAATPAEPPVPATDAAINAVRAWAAAWSDQRAEDYLSFYAPGFRPPNGLSRADWEAQRQLRLVGPSYVRVTISSLSTELASDGTVRATFGQEYESDTYADSVTKVLILTAEGGTWRILDEQATP